MVGFPELRFAATPAGAEHVHHLMIASYDPGCGAALGDGAVLVLHSIIISSVVPGSP
jgi:hypothetical protein